MNDKELCFIINNEKLFLEQVLIDYNDVPIFFICKSQKEYYLVLCGDIEDLAYIIVKVTVKDLFDMLHGHITMRESIEKNKSYWKVIPSEDVSQDIVEHKNMENIDKSILPEENAYFEILTHKTECYVKQFDDEIFRNQSFSKTKKQQINIADYMGETICPMPILEKNVSQILLSFSKKIEITSSNQNFTYGKYDNNDIAECEFLNIVKSDGIEIGEININEINNAA